MKKTALHYIAYALLTLGWTNVVLCSNGNALAQFASLSPEEKYKAYDRAAWMCQITSELLRENPNIDVRTLPQWPEQDPATSAGKELFNHIVNTFWNTKPILLDMCQCLISKAELYREQLLAHEKELRRERRAPLRVWFADD